MNHCDKATAIRRLTNRWHEQCELFPLMARDTPLDMYLAMNYRMVMAGDMLKDYEREVV
jgi:hypothetical protein